MKKTEQKVLKFITEKNLLEENDKVLLGLSGGPDSVFLLHFLKKYSRKLKIIIGAVHINHLLRGKEADRDEQFCKNLSEGLSIKFFSVKKNIKSIASREKISIEEAGRKIRYKEFENIFVKEGYTKIATAHNADENAETVLLNLVKGAGLRGLSGIPPQRDKIIRPLLILTKQEIISYLKHHKFKYRIDITNLSDDAERNFLRNQVIPLIKKKMNPSLSNTLLKSSEVFRNVFNIVKKEIDKSADKLVSIKDDYLTLSLDELEKIEYEYRSEVLRYMLNKEMGVQISFDESRKIFSLIKKQKGKSVQLPGNIRVIRERNELIIQKVKRKKAVEPIVLLSGSSVRINDKELSIKEIGTIKKKYGSNKNKNLEFISGDNITNSFLLRGWLPGDRFYPLGMKGSKKLSDFLNEQKISSYKKNDQMVLLNQDQIVWVVGLRIDERFRVKPGTKKIYQLCLS